jgi:hypothetical protein
MILPADYETSSNTFVVMNQGLGLRKIVDYHSALAAWYRGRFS